MRKIFFIFVIIFITHCAGSAQWVRVGCPQPPEALCSYGNYLFAGGEKGVYRSSNNGDTWEEVNTGLHSDIWPPDADVISSYGKFLFTRTAHLGGGLHRTTDYGDHWTEITGTPKDIVGLIGSGNRLFGSCGNYCSYLLYSLDSGNTWIVDTTGLYPDWKSHQAVARSPIVIGNLLFTLNSQGELFSSSNNGDSWNLINNNFTDSYGLYSINDSTIFLYKKDTIMRSTDNGYNWSVVKPGIGFPQIITNDGKIFVGAAGMSFSNDNGDTWKNINEGEIDSIVVDALIIHNSYLYAGAYESVSNNPGGLWRRPLSDFTNSVKKITSKNNFFLLSNPIAYSADFHFSALQEQGAFELFDLLGRQLLRKELSAGGQSLHLEMQQYPAGMYLALLGTETVRFVKE